MVTSADRGGPTDRAGPLVLALVVLAFLSAALVVLKFDPRSATAGSVGLRVFGLTLVLLGLHRYRPVHSALWWGLACYFAATVVTTVRSMLIAWSGATVNYLASSEIRFVFILIGSVSLIIGAVSLLRVRRRRTATWAVPDAVVMGWGLFTALLIAIILPVGQDIGLTLGFWTDAVVVGLRNLVILVVAVALLYSEQLRSTPVGILVAVFIMWGVSEPLVVQLVSRGVDGPVRIVLQSMLVGSIAAAAAVAGHPSMRKVALPSESPRPTWNVGRTLALTACLAAPVIAVWFRPPTTPGQLAVALAAFLILLLSVVVRMRNAVLHEHRLLNQVEELADHDELTGLPNRRYLYGAYLNLLSRRADQQEPTTLVVSYLDLDNLREVNDRLEHSGGDRLLRAVAGSLQRAATDDRTIIRVGGDEFVMLTLPCPTADPAAVAVESETLVLSSLTRLADEGFASCGSVGTSWGHIDPGPESEPDRLLDRLLQEADLAQAEAKRAGGARGVIYDVTMSTRSRTRALLRRSLPGAWAAGQMSLVYQSVEDLGTGEIFGAESLLRWTHPEIGPVPPPEAIDAAIGLGLITELGLQILDRAQQVVGDPDVPPRVRVGVNIAAPQLRPSSIDALIESVTSIGRADRVWLEVTEQLLIQERRHIAGALADLRSAGLQVAIDDFGTGYCGLDYLCSLPIDLIKLDKVFAANIDDPARRRVSQTVVQLAEALGADVVAEGLESLEVAERMHELGCRYGQGFGLRRPIASFYDAVQAR